MKDLRNTIADAVLESLELQQVFDFSGNLEVIQILGRKHICRNVEDWQQLIRINGAWGDNSVLQIFANITGITVHVVPTEFLDVDTVTHYCPRNDYMNEASISVLHGGGHFQLLAPTTLPSAVTVTLSDKAEHAPAVIDLDSEDHESRPRRKWPLFKRLSQNLKKIWRKDSNQTNCKSPQNDDSEDETPLSSRIAKMSRRRINIARPVSSTQVFSVLSFNAFYVFHCRLDQTRTLHPVLMRMS